MVFYRDPIMRVIVDPHRKLSDGKLEIKRALHRADEVSSKCVQHISGIEERYIHYRYCSQYICITAR